MAGCAAHHRPAPSRTRRRHRAARRRRATTLALATGDRHERRSMWPTRWASLASSTISRPSALDRRQPAAATSKGTIQPKPAKLGAAIVTGPNVESFEDLYDALFAGERRGARGRRRRDRRRCRCGCGAIADARAKQVAARAHRDRARRGTRSTPPSTNSPRYCRRRRRRKIGQCVRLSSGKPTPSGRDAAYMLRALLTPVSWAYAWAAAHRFRTTITRHAPVPVVCIGNLTVGGAGKTPITRAVRAKLGANAHTLSRGYGGRARRAAPRHAGHGRARSGRRTAAARARTAPPGSRATASPARWRRPMPARTCNHYG